MNKPIYSHRLAKIFFLLILQAFFISCSSNETTVQLEETPTSGLLNVYCDEAFYQKLSVQMLTYESQYPKADLTLVAATEGEAVKALYEDKCELIILGRDLSQEERKAFKSKAFSPAFSRIAETGLVLIANKQTPVSKLTRDQVQSLLTISGDLIDSVGKNLIIRVVFDHNNSSVMNYAKDSITRGKPFSQNCSSVGTSKDAIRFVQTNKNAIALIDFSWLSDQDDSLYRAVKRDIRFIPIETFTTGVYAQASQSSFKLKTYPYRRVLHAIRKTGDFTIAKGFESYLAGPKGQLTFLKQGLLPTRQGERSIHVNLN